MSKGWIGDFQFCPFAADGPITFDFGFRAVTLFQLDELIAMAKDPNKHVVLVSGPGKESALQHVLKTDALKFWDHAVIDIATAEFLDSKWTR